MIYKVWNHKTSGQFRSANIVLPLEIHNIISAYVDKHRPTPQDEFAQLVFLMPGGRQVAHVSEDLSALSQEFPTQSGRLNVTATEMRKMTATDIARDGADNATIRELATHMSHSEMTARRYYQRIEGEDGSVRAFGAISGKRQAEERTQMGPPPKKARRKWSTEEEEQLIQHFKLDAYGITPSLGKCEDFLRRTDVFQGQTMLFAQRIM